jgi:hypothetical protein
MIPAVKASLISMAFLLDDSAVMVWRRSFANYYVKLGYVTNRKRENKSDLPLRKSSSYKICVTRKLGFIITQIRR